MKHCPFENRLTTSLLGDLSPAEAEVVQAHVDACPACRATAANLAPLLDTLRAALAQDAAVPRSLDPGRLASVLAIQPPRHRRRTRFWLGPVIGLAATLFIVLGATLFFPHASPYRIPKGSGEPEFSFALSADAYGDAGVDTSFRVMTEAANEDGNGLGDNFWTSGETFSGSPHRPPEGGGDRWENGEAADRDDDGISDETEFRAGEKKPVVFRRIAPPVDTDTAKQPGWTSEAWTKDGRDGGDTHAWDSISEAAQAKASPEMRAQLQIAIADIAKARGDYPCAKAQYERVVTDPISGRTDAAKHAELKIAEVERLTRQYDVSLERLEKLDKDGDASVKSEARYQQALTKFDQEDYAGAREALARVREIAPDHAEASLLEGKLAVRTGKLMEATEIRLGSASPAADPKPSGNDTPISDRAVEEQVKSPVFFRGIVGSRTAGADTGAKGERDDKIVTARTGGSKKRPVMNPFSAERFGFPSLDAADIVQDTDHKGDIKEIRSYWGERKTGSDPMPPGDDRSSLNDSRIVPEKEGQMSRVTYMANASRAVSGRGGKMGAGGAGPGGWPDGMQDARVRFIRMKYDGAGWDDGMDEASRADVNFLDYFRNITGFKTATKAEAHPITLLAKYPKGYAPPFVFMTGDTEIRVSDKEKKILREYLLGGGMLFADCGSPQWDRSFRDFMDQLMPGANLITIADDDVLFKLPFSFNNGAPALWHHGGNHAMGLKHKGRWAVFYHPGEIHSAWKQDRGGLPSKMSEGAYEMGVNIVYYAFTHYLELTRKYRNEGTRDAPEPEPEPESEPKPEPKLEQDPAAAAPKAPRVPAAFNSFVIAAEEPFSTFAIDVDTAAFTRTRQAILSGNLPEPEAVRTEEIVNAFDYGDRAPDRATFRIFIEGAPTPFGRGTSHVRLGIKGRRLGREEARPAILTFVVDASGSMGQIDRIGLARLALDELLGRLGPNDRIQLVAFNDGARVLLDAVPPSERQAVLAAFDRIQCTGSTHLESGLRLAYSQAADAFQAGAENRVILISDGVANLGSGDAADILTHIEANRRQGITLTVFGVGRGTYNDEMLEQLANRGDGSYRFLDSADEVRRAFVDDLAATLYTIASDVKIQVEWFPAAVARYRQMGYENRALTTEQFRDDTVDAGEVGSGQAVTALYEIEPVAPATHTAADAQLGVVRVRYRPATGGAVDEISRPILASDLSGTFQATRPQFRIAVCAAAFAERLRCSPYADGYAFADVADALRPVVTEFTLDARLGELLRLVESAARLSR